MRGSSITTIKYFTDKELDLIFKELEKDSLTARTTFQKKCAVRNEAMFKIMYYCALRVSETTLLSLDSYNTLRKEMYCKRLKGGKNNTLELLDEDHQGIVKALDIHIKTNNPTDKLFCCINNDQKSLSRKTLDYLIKKHCKRANISNQDKWHCHAMRHTRAIKLAEKGLDLKDIQYWLGHADISNTMIYFEFTTKQHEAMYKKLKESKNKK